MPKPKRAPRAPVIYLTAARKARSAQPVVEAAECCPYAVMQTMIDAYFSALSIQMAKLNAERRKV